MKYLLLTFALSMVGCSSKKEQEQPWAAFVYLTPVEVTGGFYKGQTGTIKIGAWVYNGEYLSKGFIIVLDKTKEEVKVEQFYLKEIDKKSK